MKLVFEKKPDADTLIHNLCFLSEKYCTAMPGSNNPTDQPEVSLHLHQKTVAAFATCLYRAQNTNKPFILAGVNLSGIQSFIYNITGKNALKNLRGRSFYLQLITEHTLWLILNKLKLSTVHTLYNSGGGFYLLLPNTSETKEVLENCVNQMNNILFENHSVDLYLAMGYKEFSEADTKIDDTNQVSPIGEIWKDLKLFNKYYLHYSSQASINKVLFYCNNYKSAKSKFLPFSSFSRQ
jgi:CRISPR-associated protein Csm1